MYNISTGKKTMLFFIGFKMTFAYSYRAICWIYAVKCSSIGRVHKFSINKQLVGHVHCHVVHIHVHLQKTK